MPPFYSVLFPQVFSIVFLRSILMFFTLRSTSAFLPSRAFLSASRQQRQAAIPRTELSHRIPTCRVYINEYFLQDQPRFFRRLFSSSTDIEALEEQIRVKGDEIRQYKTEGMNKADLTPHIEELLSLKAKLEPPKEKSNSGSSKIKTKKEPAAALSDSELRRNRLAKVQVMRDAGIEPFAYTFVSTHTAAQLHELYPATVLTAGSEDETASISVAGRILTRRVFGKLAFFSLQDESGETIQLQFDTGRLGKESFKVGTFPQKIQWLQSGGTHPCISFHCRTLPAGRMEATSLERQVPFDEQTRES